jgi:hypothetical protein
LRISAIRPGAFPEKSEALFIKLVKLIFTDIVKAWGFEPFKSG